MTISQNILTSRFKLRIMYYVCIFVFGYFSHQKWSSIQFITNCILKLFLIKKLYTKLLNYLFKVKNWHVQSRPPSCVFYATIVVKIGPAGRTGRIRNWIPVRSGRPWEPACARTGKKTGWTGSSFLKKINFF